MAEERWTCRRASNSAEVTPVVGDASWVMEEAVEGGTADGVRE